jgi:2-alkenal reductase
MDRGMITRRFVGICAGAATLFCWSAVRAAESQCIKSAAEIFREVSPSVVQILSMTIDPFRGGERVNYELGTGIVFDDAGNIVSNAHVVYGARQLLVITDGQEMRDAKLVGADPVSDLAVIKVVDGAPLSLPKADFSDSTGLVVGQDVVAIGFPLGIGKTASRGIVSGLDRQLPVTTMSWLVPLIQTDAAINPGNSGGPLIDSCGKVVGINTRQNDESENIGFAVPASAVRNIVPELIARGRVIRPWHGIAGKMVPELFIALFGMQAGLLVETVEPGSPAEKIGLHGGLVPVTIGSDGFLLGGEIITSVNGQTLADLKQVGSLVRSFKVGDEVTLTYWQDGEEKTAKVVLPERPTLTGDLVAIGRN